VWRGAARRGQSERVASANACGFFHEHVSLPPMWHARHHREPSHQRAVARTWRAATRPERTAPRLAERDLAETVETDEVKVEPRELVNALDEVGCVHVMPPSASGPKPQACQHERALLVPLYANAPRCS